MWRGKKKKKAEEEVLVAEVATQNAESPAAPPEKVAPAEPIRQAEPVSAAVAERAQTVPTERAAPTADQTEPHAAASVYPDPAVPFEIARHNGAGLKLYKHSKFKQVQLKFERDVPPDLHHELERDHWRFRPEEGVYTKQYSFDGEGASIVEARRLYGAICQRLTPNERGR